MSDPAVQERLKLNLLLRKMLPASAIQQLQSKSQQLLLDSAGTVSDMDDGVVFEKRDRVCVLFSHVAGFDDLTLKMGPVESIQMLNDLFSCFDSITDDLGVYKVETIGDVYLVCSGCPEEFARAEGDVTRVICRVAQRMKEAMGPFHANKYVFHKVYCPSVSLCIGVHTGPVIAGVVGDISPRYRLMGDTVNTASRMSTTCEPGEIQVRTHAMFSVSVAICVCACMALPHLFFFLS